MNILFLLRLWPVYGGGETVTITLANEMVKRGWNVYILFFKDCLRDKLPFIDSRIQVMKINDVQCDEFYASVDDANKVVEFTKKYIVSNEINFVINQWWPVEYIRGLNCGRAKVVKCLHQALYTPIFEKKSCLGLMKWVLKPIYLYKKKKQALKTVDQFLPFVDKYIFLSDAFLRQYECMQLSKYDKDKLYSIPNPIANDKLSCDANEKEKIVLFVGRMLEGQKRVSRAIKAWSLIEKNSQFNEWKFVIVGDGPDFINYKRLVSHLKLNRVYFEGVQDPKPYYKNAKIFWMTSAFEGFGMTLVEASQYGAVPVVMDSFLSLHDIIEDGYNGCIVPNNDISLFAKKTIELMQNDNPRNELAQNAVRSIDKFRVERIVNQWEKLFLGMTNED